MCSGPSRIHFRRFGPAQGRTGGRPATGEPLLLQTRGGLLEPYSGDFPTAIDGLPLLFAGDLQLARGVSQLVVGEKRVMQGSVLPRVFHFFLLINLCYDLFTEQNSQKSLSASWVGQTGTKRILPSVAFDTDSSSASAISEQGSCLYRCVDRSPFSNNPQSFFTSSFSSAERCIHQSGIRYPPIVIPFITVATPFLRWKGAFSSAPYICTNEFGFNPEIRVSSTGPPPKQSNKILKPPCFRAVWQSASQSPLVTITWVAPSALSKSACSCFLTMLRRGIPRVRQRLFSILPKADAAAV